MASGSKESSIAAITLLLQGLQAGKLELVAESKLRGHPFAQLNQMPESIENTFFSLYCYDPEWIEKIENSTLVARNRRCESSSLSDGRVAVKFKLHGEREKELLQGVETERGKVFYRLRQQVLNRQPTMDLVKEDASGERSVYTLSGQAFGTRRLFAVLPQEVLQHCDLALAKAAPADGMSDILLIRSSRDRDAITEALREVGLYQTGNKRFIAPNAASQGQVTAIYIPKAVAESIRATAENDVIDFKFESPDIAELSDAINNSMEPTEALMAFMDDSAPPQTLCDLAAAHWPNPKHYPITRAQLPRARHPQKAGVMVQPPSLGALVKEQGITPEHYTVIQTRLGDGKLRLRLQVNSENVMPRCDNATLWMIGDASQCSQPLDLEYANISHEPLRRVLAPMGTAEKAESELARLEQALGGAICRISQPFALQENALDAKPVMVRGGRQSIEEKLGVERLCLTAVGNTHYLALSAARAERLNEKFVGLLGFPKPIALHYLQREDEIPAVAVIEIKPEVAADIATQIDQSSRLQAKTSLLGKMASSVTMADAVRQACGVRKKAALTTASIAPVVQKPFGASAPSGDPTPAEDDHDPLQDAGRKLAAYPPSQVLVQKLIIHHPQTGESQTRHAIAITDRAQAHGFVPLQRALAMCKDEAGEPLVDDADMVVTGGHDNRHALFHLDDVPEELLEALQADSRGIETETIELAGEPEDGILAEQARSYFRKPRSQPVAQAPKPDPMVQLLGKSLSLLTVSYPDDATWQGMKEQAQDMLAHIRQWQQTPHFSHDEARHAAALGITLSAYRYGMSSLGLAAGDVQRGTDHIQDAMAHAHRAQQEIEAEDHWMKAHLSEARTTTALVVKDVGKKGREMIDALQSKGVFTRPPHYIHYRKLREGKKRRQMGAEACTLYPTEAFLTELKRHGIGEFKRLNDWQVEGQSPPIPVEQLAECLNDHFDVGAIRAREEAQRKPAKAIEDVCRHLQQTMPNQCLLVRERHNNPVDGKRTDRHKAEQGVGVAEEDKGSQLVLVAVVDRRTIKEFERQVLDKLTDAKLLAGQKIYESKVTVRARTLDAGEAAIHTLQKAESDIRSYQQSQDMGYRLGSTFVAQCGGAESASQLLNDESSFALRLYEKQQERNPELFKTLRQWAQQPSVTDAVMSLPSAMLFGALLAHQLDQQKPIIEAYQEAAQEFADYHRMLKAKTQEVRDASSHYGAVDANQRVVKARHLQPCCYDLNGESYAPDELVQWVSASPKPVVVKCYLSTDAEQLSKQMDGNPLRRLKETLRADLPAQGRRDIALTDDALLGQATGKYTSRLRSEADLVQQVRYAVTDDHAITPHELKILMGKYFEADRGRGAA